MTRINLYFVILVSFAFGCAPAPNNQIASDANANSAARNQDQRQVIEPNQKPNFGDEDKNDITFYYRQYSQYCLPVSPEPSTLPLETIAKYLNDNSHEIIELSEILSHDNQWNRWTVAKLMGQYGQADCVPYLQRRLEIEELDHVKNDISEAIDFIQLRHRKR